MTGFLHPASTDGHIWNNIIQIFQNAKNNDFLNRSISTIYYIMMIIGSDGHKSVKAGLEAHKHLKSHYDGTFHTTDPVGRSR